MNASTIVAAGTGATTRTGAFGIGFRLGWSEWQKNIDTMIDYAREQNFSCIDLLRNADETAARVYDAGLQVGSVDLKQSAEMIHADANVRKRAVEMNSQYVATVAGLGVKHFFLVMGPSDASIGYEKNWAYMIESFSALAPVLEEHDARIVIEGCPFNGALVVAPESYRAFFKEIDSPSMGINYDPSHLIRMGVDPIRFAREFAQHIFHVHAKDTEIFTENQYECGHEHVALKTDGHAFGNAYWRYTIPGHGQMRWVELFKILAERGYQGQVSVELEDENFNGTQAGEAAGMAYARAFLESC